MNEAVTVGGLAMFASTALIIVLGLSAAGILTFCEKRAGHLGDH
ncbi:hypothetical protein WKI13_19210 [Teredinibacter turnerae]|nr:hypothetical protein [Teredinibacter turnerae]